MAKAFDLSQYMPKLNVSESNTKRNEVVLIPARKVFPNDMNFYDVSDVSDLVNSILIHGLLEPIVVRTSGDGESYIVISGHRRHKAWMTILDDNLSANPDEFLEIPCFITEPKDELIEELMLIQANSATRVLTSAEVSKQAERVEELVYRLKEQGYEFPGRMRDTVAAMCNVSATKLAKLKVIREGLCSDYLAQFSASLITEQAAYSIARLPKEFQQRLYKVDPTISGCNAANIVSAYFDRGWRWEPQQSCPDGKPCKRGDTFLRHDINCCSYEMCGGNKCCLECERGKSQYYACDRACSKLQEIRKKDRDKKAEADAKAAKVKQSKLQTEIRASCARLARAADAAELSDNFTIKMSDISHSLGKIRSYAKGEFGNSNFYENDFAPTAIRNYPELCKALKCSADYLAGLTDDLNPAPAPTEPASAPIEAEPAVSGLPKIQTGRPAASGLFAGKFECEGHVMKKLAYYYSPTDKFYFDKTHGTSIDANCVGWIRLPDEF